MALDLHTTGLHQHQCDFQMFYVTGGCVLQPPGIVHNEFECSDDIEVLEIFSRAVHETVVVDTMPEAAAAH